ncbi:MAG TPA: hypothetical protein VHQ48_17265 [Bradyrhizobium sp.]|jgi:hypothetical protein|nr:hypothetical protein [Bradyrhizobium sp.]
MTSQDPNGVQINRVHSDAIRTEIGERLCATLPENRTEVPTRLLSLAALLDTVVHGDVAFNDPIKIDLR